MTYRSESDESYFRDCKWCGQRIHMRQMPAGQWVAFDDARRVHDCQNESAYNEQEAETVGSGSSRTRQLYSSDAPTVRTPTYTTTSRALLWKPLLVVLLLLLVLGFIVARGLGEDTADVAQSYDYDSLPAVVEEVPEQSDGVEAAPEATPSPEEEGVEARIVRKDYDFIYVRRGPALAYPEVGRVYSEQRPFTALGRSPDGRWVAVRLRNGTEGWILREFVVSEQPFGTLPKVEIPEPEGVRAHIDLQEYDWIYVQEGPGIDFPEVGRIYDTRTTFVVFGRTSDSEWFLVRLPNGTVGWIMGEFVVGERPLRRLPVY